jgi:hypothetical protein
LRTSHQHWSRGWRGRWRRLRIGRMRLGQLSDCSAHATCQREGSEQRPNKFSHNCFFVCCSNSFRAFLNSLKLFFMTNSLPVSADCFNSSSAWLILATPRSTTGLWLGEQRAHAHTQAVDQTNLAQRRARASHARTLRPRRAVRRRQWWLKFSSVAFQFCANKWSFSVDKMDTGLAGRVNSSTDADAALIQFN